MEIGYTELDDLISKTITKMSLTPMQKNHLSKLVGKELNIEIENNANSIINWFVFFFSLELKILVSNI